MQMYQSNYNNWQNYNQFQYSGQQNSKYSADQTNINLLNNQVQQTYYQQGSQSNSPGLAYEEKYKTELCKNWQKNGKCPYKNRCRFAHGKQEMKNTSSQQSQYFYQQQQQSNNSLKLVAPKPIIPDLAQLKRMDDSGFIEQQQSIEKKLTKHRKSSSYNSELNTVVEKYLNKIENQQQCLKKSRFSQLFKQDDNSYDIETLQKKASSEDYEMIFSQKNSSDNNNLQDQTNWDINDLLTSYPYVKQQSISSSESLKQEEGSTTSEGSEEIEFGQKSIYTSI